MGKSWFSVVKKALSPEPKQKKDQDLKLKCSRLEAHLEKVKRKCSDLEAQLLEEKAKVLAAIAPLSSFDDSVFDDFFEFLCK
ncbi:unnamed protein product [Arabidopsis lyrata]|uniref:Predicted protein n=1 Tax=Arabidopsis lyrata subsp. lyrata TaxID=81972 RepID=D7L072_ARALL|nr:predicted protein [Arabidopsis lyrata subsp. lyrata]CAH8262486.1 unnamed protein product [Arabidopsis lyrata]